MWTGNKKTIKGKYCSKILYEYKCDDCGKLEYRSAKQHSTNKHFKVKSTYCNKCRKTNGHGETHRETINRASTRLYQCWMNMKRRCCDNNNVSYYLYGGKGIKVCEEWLDFVTFKDWAMSNGYKDNLTIDRKDSDKNYCPNNCRFVTKLNNSRNTKSLKYKLTYKGKTLTIKEWSDILGLNYQRIFKRMKNGRPIEEILTTDSLVGKR
jgi:hypothetical protein